MGLIGHKGVFRVLFYVLLTSHVENIHKATISRIFPTQLSYFVSDEMLRAILDCQTPSTKEKAV